MKITVEFRCPACGLLTPGMAELPDDVDQRRMGHFTHGCFHCDKPLERKARVSDLLREQTGGAAETGGLT